MPREDHDTHVEVSFTRYEPTRTARLRLSGAEPPPLPDRQALGDGFGAADEDGLRMLAALGTLTSLEPDYSDDFAAEEASVTIIDATDDGTVAAAFAAQPVDTRPLRRLIEQPAEPALLLNGYETFLGPGDEAMVEIVNVSTLPQEPEPEPPSKTYVRPASLTERLAAATGPGARFLKALSGN